MADRLSKLLSESLVNFDSKLLLASVQGLNLRNSSLSKYVFDHFSVSFEESELSNIVTDWLLHFLANRDFPEKVAVRVSHLVVKRVLEKSNLNDLKLLTKSGHEKYSSEKLESSVLVVMKEVGEEWMRKIQKGIDDDDDLNNFFLPLPLTVSSHAIKNTRRRMEDRHLCMQLFSTLYHLPTDYKLFGVFDGHGGVEAARYASINFPHLLALLISSICNSHGGWGLGSSVDGDDVENSVCVAMKTAFTQCDDLFCERTKLENNQSGCTGVVVLLEGKSGIYIGWVGDSQVMLVRGGKAVTVMNPHKPEREDERKRIVSLGGTVDYVGAWRVNGTLSVSRAIGDSSFKPWICSDADTTYLPRHHLDQYLVIACDGLWDVVTFDEVIQHVTDHMMDPTLEEKSKRSSVASTLVKIAKKKGSQDNITVVVVFLDEDVAVKETDTVKKGPDKVGNKTRNSECNDAGGLSDCSARGGMGGSMTIGSAKTKSTGDSQGSESKASECKCKDAGRSKSNEDAAASDSANASSNDDSKKNYLDFSDDSNSGDGRGVKPFMSDFVSDENKENVSGNSRNLVTVSGNSHSMVTVSGESGDKNNKDTCDINKIILKFVSGHIDIKHGKSGTLDKSAENTINKTSHHHHFPKSSQFNSKVHNKVFVSTQGNYLTQTKSVVSSYHQQLKLQQPQHHQQKQHTILKTSLSTKSLFQRLPIKHNLQSSKERWTMAVEAGEDLREIFHDDIDRFNTVSAKW